MGENSETVRSNLYIEVKILVISFSLSSGGAERFAVDLCNTLSGKHEVIMLTTDNDDVAANAYYRNELDSSIKYINLAARSGHSVSALLGILRVIRKERPDLVHAHTDLVQLFLPAIFCKGIKYVHTIHSVADYYLQFKLEKPFFRRIYARSVIPVTISPVCSESYRNLYGLGNDVMILNGRSRPSLSDSADSVRERILEFKDGKPLFIHVARYAPPKNQKVLFEAVKLAGDVRLVVIGRDFPAGMQEAQDPERVLFEGERMNVGDYLRLADYFILSSTFEGLPLSLLEAMSYGVVPVSTPAGGVRDVVRDGENGFLAKGFQAEDLADAMRRAVAAKVDRDAIIAEYENGFSMEACAARYQHLFETIVR